jgi:hypothetical protein
LPCRESVYESYLFFLLQTVTEDKYEILQSVDDAAIVIKNTKEPPLSLTIHLTSPVVREEMEKVLAGGREAERGQQNIADLVFPLAQMCYSVLECSD